ncbi:MAG: hypothetical protein GF411_06120, partial [Candidatus Lokiarchaeota archaeon]|nr:hypothetical protein [Candidatus Lokiarchaeota archaeon]
MRVQYVVRRVRNSSNWAVEETIWFGAGPLGIKQNTWYFGTQEEAEQFKKKKTKEEEERFEKEMGVEE